MCALNLPWADFWGRQVPSHPPPTHPGQTVNKPLRTLDPTHYSMCGRYSIVLFIPQPNSPVFWRGWWQPSPLAWGFFYLPWTLLLEHVGRFQWKTITWTDRMGRLVGRTKITCCYYYPIYPIEPTNNYLPIYYYLHRLCRLGTGSAVPTPVSQVPRDSSSPCSTLPVLYHARWTLLPPDITCNLPPTHPT